MYLSIYVHAYVCRLPRAAQDKDRAAIVKEWADEAGKENAPVAELVSAAKFAAALADDNATKQFKQQAMMLKNYMQNSPKFCTHFFCRAIISTAAVTLQRSCLG
jgi:hypothetical protein